MSGLGFDLGCTPPSLRALVSPSVFGAPRAHPQGFGADGALSEPSRGTAGSLPGPAWLLWASREQAPTHRADRATAPAFLRASVSPRAERVSRLLAWGGFRARPSTTFKAAFLERRLHTGPCWEGSCLQPCLWRVGGSRWLHGPDVTQLCGSRLLGALSGTQFHLQSNGNGPLPHPLVHPRPFTFSSPEGAAPGVGVSPGPELHLAATRGHRGGRAPRAGPTDSPGQVAAGWTSLFPAFLCNQVMQGQPACLHKGRRARPWLGRGRLLKGPVYPESAPRGPAQTPEGRLTKPAQRCACRCHRCHHRCRCSLSRVLSRGSG